VQIALEQYPAQELEVIAANRFTESDKTGQQDDEGRQGGRSHQGPLAKALGGIPKQAVGGLAGDVVGHGLGGHAVDRKGFLLFHSVH
jgi:hypothetical protein